MRLNLVNAGVRYNAMDVRLDSGKASDKTLSLGNLDASDKVAAKSFTDVDTPSPTKLFGAGEAARTLQPPACLHSHVPGTRYMF
eukprot:SAG31_NODE_1524_length_8006_cov_11.768812_5_plen_84_part_00